MERFRNLAEVWRQLRTLDPKAAGWIILAAAGGLVRGLGGAVLHGPFGTPFGAIAVCRDPMGTHFTLMTPKPRG